MDLVRPTAVQLGGQIWRAIVPQRPKQAGGRIFLALLFAERTMEKDVVNKLVELDKSSGEHFDIFLPGWQTALKGARGRPVKISKGSVRWEWNENLWSEFCDGLSVDTDGKWRRPPDGKPEILFLYATVETDPDTKVVAYVPDLSQTLRVRIDNPESDFVDFVVLARQYVAIGDTRFRTALHKLSDDLTLRDVVDTLPSLVTALAGIVVKQELPEIQRFLAPGSRRLVKDLRGKELKARDRKAARAAPNPK